jgi:flagellar hook assembly protein FlgD
VCAAAALSCSKPSNVILDTILDQENAPVSTTSSKKRPAGQLDCQPGGKKQKKAPAATAAASKAGKKKAMPLQKGQKQLTSFFRI